MTDIQSTREPPDEPSQSASLIDMASLLDPDVPMADAWNELVAVAVLHHASDIHLTYQSDGLHIALRIDGQYREQGRIGSFEVANHVTNHVKVLTGLDPADRRRPQSGRSMAIVDGRKIDLRLSALPTAHGQDLVIRVLDRSTSLLDVDELGMTRRELNRLLSLVSVPSGLVLVSGPTGAGKTTTLYAVLNRLNRATRKIITIEDPIEFDLTSIHQTQVNERLGVDYRWLLETVLRQDANVIMVGEIRDVETAATAVRAAATGHLVFATTHALGAASAIETLMNLDTHPHFLSTAVRGVISQNLVRRICPHCVERLEETAAMLPLDDVRDLIEEEDEAPALAMGRGCRRCFQSGYLGRMGLFEIMIGDETIRRLIERERPSEEIHEAAVKAGMVTLQQSGKLAVFHGHTTVEELIRTISLDATTAVPTAEAVMAKPEPAE